MGPTSLFLWLSNFMLWSHRSRMSSPLDPSAICVASSTSIVHLIDCFDQYTSPEGSYDNATYSSAQPTQDEVVGWTEAIGLLLNSSTQTPSVACSDLPVPPAIADSYRFYAFRDMESLEDYCLLSESTSMGGSYYAKGWGLFVVRLSAEKLRSLHFSAPHPRFDIDTPQQAAALFQSVNATSLLIAGRHRRALGEPSPCIQPSSSTSVYYKTDPTHDNEEPFFPASMAILDWQLAKPGGCPADKCAFVQFHGKGSSTCPEDLAFLSSGLARSPSSVAWYTDNVDRPVKRIAHFARLHFNPSNVTLPSESDCILTATKNVVGRVMNRVSRSEVCSSEATADGATGMFVHIEQARLARSSTHYDTWRRVFLDAFPKAE